MLNLGKFDLGDLIYVPWTTYSSNGASADPTAYGSIRIYENSSTTELTTSGVVTNYHDFDGITGNHLIAINTGADEVFFVNGNEYSVCLVGATIDSQVVNAVLATFSLSGEASIGSVRRQVWRNDVQVSETVYFYATRV